MTDKPDLVPKQRDFKGWLVVLEGRNKGRDFRLFSGKNIVGSNPHSAVYLPGEDIEPFHFSIRFEKDASWLTDLDSNSGLFIGGERIFRKEISDELRFTVPCAEFRIKLF